MKPYLRGNVCAAVLKKTKNLMGCEECIYIWT